jgi:hypothetical protein
VPPIFHQIFKNSQLSLRLLERNFSDIKPKLSKDFPLIHLSWHNGIHSYCFHVTTVSPTWHRDQHVKTTRR